MGRWGWRGGGGQAWRMEGTKRWARGGLREGKVIKERLWSGNNIVQLVSIC